MPVIGVFLSLVIWGLWICFCICFPWLGVMSIAIIVFAVWHLCKTVKQNAAYVQKEKEFKVLEQRVRDTKEDMRKFNAAEKITKKEKKLRKQFQEKARKYNLHASQHDNPELQKVLNKISFSEWVNWKDRDTIDGLEFSGVYLLGHFSNPPSGCAEPSAPEIIYISETRTQSLRKCWNRFDKSAFDGKKSHADGVKYSSLFKAESRDRLFVAAVPFVPAEHKELSPEENKELSPLLVEYVKIRLLFRYIEKYGEFPQCGEFCDQDGNTEILKLKG